MNKLNRRRFILGAILSAPFLVVADAKWIEPKWIKIRRLRMGSVRPTHRFVHIADMGLFRTPSGPLYVNPGIGWFPVPIRFNCRPEITVFEV